MSEDAYLEPPNKRPWTSQEIGILKAQAHLGAEGLAILLQRPVTAVKWQAHRQRISLRKKGSKRGLIMGQPKGVSWMAQAGHGLTADRLEEMRAQALEGVIDLPTLEQRIRENTNPKKERPLCPVCVQRPQERTSTGLCEACHLRELARAHRDEMDRREARRDLWRARQESSRSRRRAEAIEE